MEQAIPTISIQTIVLSTMLSILGAIIGGMITGIFSLRSKDKEYQNEYYKMVLEKRMKAYEVLNEINGTIKFYLKNGKEQWYPACFNDKKSLINAKAVVDKIADNELWLSKRAMEVGIKLQRNFLKAGEYKSDAEIIEFGIMNYEKFRSIKWEISTILNEDILSLHKINEFLKSKNERESKCLFYAKKWMNLKFKSKIKFPESKASGQ